MESVFFLILNKMEKIGSELVFNATEKWFLVPQRTFLVKVLKIFVLFCFKGYFNNLKNHFPQYY